MKFFLIFLTFFFIEATCSMEEHKVSQKEMGFEVESSAFKINVGPNTEKKKVILVRKADQKPVLQIEEDSMDYHLNQSNFSHYERNLEIKTLGGFNKGEISEIAQDVALIFEKLKNATRSGKRQEVNIHDKTEVVYKPNQPINIQDIVNTDKYALEGGELIWDIVERENPKAELVTQISYKIPLENIPDLFQRMADYKHDIAFNFLNILTNSSKENEQKLDNFFLQIQKDEEKLKKIKRRLGS